MSKVIKDTKRRILSIITLIALIVTMLPANYATAYGTDSEETNQVAQEHSANPEYAPGTYYGGGKGYNSLSTNNQLGVTGKIAFPGEDTLKVKVEVVEGDDGVNKISSIKVIEFRDDVKPYGKIAENVIPYIIRDNGVGKSKTAIQNKDERDPRYDEVSSATWTAQGIVEAVENALEGSTAKAAGTESGYAYLEVDSSSTFKTEVPFDKPISFEGLVLKGVYKDGSKPSKIIPYSQFKAEGITINKENGFVINRDGNQLQQTQRVVISGPGVNKMGFSVTAVAPAEAKYIKEFKLTFKDNKTKTIYADKENFLYSTDVAKGDSAEIVKVVAIANDGSNAQIDKFYYDQTLREWTILLKPLSGNDYYVFDGYRVKINDKNIDGNTITRFSLYAQPTTVDYYVGDSFSLKGMSVSFAKGTDKTTYKTDGDWLAKEKITPSIPEGTVFKPSDIGTKKVTLKIDDSVASANTEREISFEINVMPAVENTDPPETLAFMGTGPGGTKVKVGEIKLESGKNVYPKAGWALSHPARELDNLEIVVYDKNGKVVPQQTTPQGSKDRVTTYKKGAVTRVYFDRVHEGFGETEGGQSYVFLNMMAPPMPNQVVYYDLGDINDPKDDKEVAKADFNQGATSAAVNIPAEYKNAQLTPKLYYVNNGEKTEIPLNMEKTKVTVFTGAMAKDTLVITGTGMENGYEDYYSQWTSGKFFAIKNVQPYEMTESLIIDGKKVYYKEITGESEDDLSVKAGEETVAAKRVAGTDVFYAMVGGSISETYYGTASMTFGQYWKNEGLTSPSAADFEKALDKVDREGMNDVGGFDAVSRATTKHGIFRGAFQFIIQVVGKDGNGETATFKVVQDPILSETGKLTGVERPGATGTIILGDGAKTFVNGGKEYTIQEYKVLGIQMVPTKVDGVTYVEAMVLNSAGKGTHTTEVFKNFKVNGTIISNLAGGKVAVDSDTPGLKTLNSDGTYSAAADGSQANSLVGYNIKADNIEMVYNTKYGDYADGYIYLVKSDGATLTNAEFLGYATNYVGAKYEYFGTDNKEATGEPLAVYGSKPMADVWWSTNHGNRIDVGFLFEALRFGGDGETQKIQTGYWKVTLRANGYNDVSAILHVKDNHTITVKPEANLSPDRSSVLLTITDPALMKEIKAGTASAQIMMGRTAIKSFDGIGENGLDVKDTDLVGKYMLIISTEGFADQRITLDASPTAVTEPGSKDVTIQASEIYVQKLGEPTSEIKVGTMVPGRRGPEFKSLADVNNNDTGKFNFANLENGDYVLQLKVPGYPVNLVPFTLSKAEPKVYQILDGADSIWETGDLVIRIDAPITEFVELKVDGVPVDSANFGLTEGSTIVTVYQGYMETLAAGAHSVEVNFLNGMATTGFTAQPKAGSINPNLPPAPPVNPAPIDGQTPGEPVDQSLQEPGAVTGQPAKTGDDNLVGLGIFTLILAATVAAGTARRKDN